jgi:hypothetical protein
MAKWPDFEVAPGGKVKVVNFNTGELAPEVDQALTDFLPEDKEAGETFAVWLYDGEADIGMQIRIHPTGGKASGYAQIFLPGGRILNADPEEGVITRGDAPETAHVKYRVVEPFHRWEYRLTDLPMAETSDAAMGSGEVRYGPPSVTVSLELEGSLVAPAWIQGSLLPEAYEGMKGPVGIWIAGRLNSGLSPASFRYDQALAATGTVKVDGEQFPFKGYGLRGHVRGVRRTDGFKFHTWIGAVFPDTNRAVGVQTHGIHGLPGGYAWSEAYVFQDDTLYANRIIYAPPVSPQDPHGEFVLQLACDELGLTQIFGHDTRVMWTSLGSLGLGTPRKGGATGSSRNIGLRKDAPYVMSQAVTRYDWDGDIGYGMQERSGENKCPYR